MKLKFYLAGAMLVAIGSAALADEEAFLTNARQLTFEGKRSGEGYFSPDGTKLTFQSEREPGNPFYQIYLLDLTTGDSSRVSPGHGKTTCSFIQSSAGAGEGRVLFASTHHDPKSLELQQAELDFRASGKERRYSWDYDEHFEIFTANPDGSDVRRLTDAVGYDAEGAFSPDGAKIAFSSMRSAYPPEDLSDEERKMLEVNPAYFGEIFIMNADGSGQTRLTSTPGYDGGPFFSPDGERVIWRRFNKEGTLADVYTMALDGSDVRRLTDFRAMSWAPYFHPSGDYAIFASNKLGFANFELYIVDALGTKEPVRVSFTDGFDGLPVFSPDGTKLAWTSTRYKKGSGRAGGQLFLANWNDAAAREALEASPARGAQSESRPAQSSPSVPSASQPTAGPAQDHTFQKSVTTDDLRAHVEYLADEALDGRLTGTEGERLAAEYIADQMKAAGLQSFEGTAYFQGFEFTAGVKMGPANRMSVATVEANPHLPLSDLAADAKDKADFVPGENFRPLTVSDVGTTEGLLAFAGYGLVVPGEGDEPAYDSYADLDVTDKIVLVLRFVPEGVDAATRQVYNRYAGLRYKALQARERGAAGLLVVSGPNSPKAGELIGLGMDFVGASSGILGASLDLETADALLRSGEKSLADMQTALDTGEEIPGFVLDDTLVRLEIDLETVRRRGANVVGYIPPAGDTANVEYIVVGAHYDHLGRGRGGDSLARKGEEGQVHYGADDNASGVAAMLEIAAELAHNLVASPQPLQRGIIFAAWSGEEVGLLGSKKFCTEPPVPLANIVGYLNMDMVGRVEQNKLSIQGVGSSADWRSIIERKNVVAGFSLSLAEDPYLPTDVMSFYLEKIPSIHFFSGAHEDYHRPTDTPEKINYSELKRVAEFVRLMATTLASQDGRPAYAEVTRPERAAGGRDVMRAYLGTIPDYTTEIETGVLLSGVQTGGPADKAGLQGGDIILQFGGQTITNIYDYTYSLDAVKIGEATELVIQRGEERLTLTITPEARN